MKENWTIIYADFDGSCVTGMGLRRVTGTEEEVKKHLIQLLKSLTGRDTADWEYGTRTPEEIKEFRPGTGTLVARASGRAYFAVRESQLPADMLDKDGQAATRHGRLYLKNDNLCKSPGPYRSGSLYGIWDYSSCQLA